MGSFTYKKWFWLIISLYAVLSLIHGFTLPLTADEAHYALYGQKLALSYFDHPPMVGWIQSVALILGESEWILRIFPVLFTGFSLWLLFDIARRAFDEKTAYVTLMLFATTPILQLIPIGMIPETPLVLIGLLLFRLMFEFNPGQVRLHHWLTMGLLLGLAGLSKYTAVTLGLSVGLLLLFRFGFSLFKQAGLYWAVLITLIVISPVLIWNAQNDWISFLYQLGHGAGKYEANLHNALKMQVGQFAAYGPLIYISGWVLVFSFFKKLVLKKVDKTWLPFLIFALPILILFSITAAKGRSLPHWTELGVIFLLPLIANWLVDHWHRRHNWWIRTVASLSLIIALAAQLVLFDPGFKYPDYKHPTRDLIGWKEIGLEMADLGQESDHLFIPNWSHASRVAWYGRPYEVKVLDSRFDQFDMWFGQVETGDRGILLLHDEGKGFEEEYLDLFKACVLIRDKKVHSGRSLVNHFKLYRCESYQGDIKSQSNQSTESVEQS